MSSKNSTENALENLREFQEMSYSDVYTLIWQKRFDEAKTKYRTVYNTLHCDIFDASLNIEISSSHDDMLEFMSTMAGNVAEPEKIKAVGFDLSSHALYENEEGICDQGVEVNLYSEDVYDFLGATDDELKEQCQSVSSAWQGSFMDIATFPLKGLGPVARQFYDFAVKTQDTSMGVIETPEGGAVVNPVMIAKHVAKLLLAIEYHQFMAEFVEQVEVPSQMIFIIGEHDEIEVPIVFYRVGEDEVQAVELTETETPALYAETQDYIGEETDTDTDTETNIDTNTALELAAAEQEYPAEQEPAQEVSNAPLASDNSSDINQANENELEAEDASRVYAQSRIGLPLKAKTFGQRMYKPVDEIELNEDELGAI